MNANLATAQDESWFCPGDQVMHPRLGRGRVLRLKQNGTLVVRFHGARGSDVLFPFQLERLKDPERSLVSGLQTAGQCGEIE